jgi:hypothetical protein
MMVVTLRELSVSPPRNPSGTSEECRNIPLFLCVHCDEMITILSTKGLEFTSFIYP